jgi:hypothetical protein
MTHERQIVVMCSANSGILLESIRSTTSPTGYLVVAAGAPVEQPLVVACRYVRTC